MPCLFMGKAGTGEEGEGWGFHLFSVFFTGHKDYIKLPPAAFEKSFRLLVF